ncbi:MAG: hypothetical protein AAF517_10520 [Planctomycetota bacterium]
MKGSSRKWFTISLTLATISLVVYLGVTQAYPYLLESWKIRQLDSDDRAVRDAAAKWLGEKRSVRSIPRLIELSIDSSGAPPATTPLSFCVSVSSTEQALIDLGEPALASLVDHLHQRDSNPLYCVFFGIGPEAVDPLMPCVEEHSDPRCLELAVNALALIAKNESLSEDRLMVLVNAISERAESESGNLKQLLGLQAVMIKSQAFRRRQREFLREKLMRYGASRTGDGGE